MPGWVAVPQGVSVPRRVRALGVPVPRCGARRWDGAGAAGAPAFPPQLPGGPSRGLPTLRSFHSGGRGCPAGTPRSEESAWGGMCLGRNGGSAAFRRMERQLERVSSRPSAFNFWPPDVSLCAPPGCGPAPLRRLLRIWGGPAKDPRTRRPELLGVPAQPGGSGAAGLPVPLPLQAAPGALFVLSIWQDCLCNLSLCPWRVSSPLG